MSQGCGAFTRRDPGSRHPGRSAAAVGRHARRGRALLVHGSNVVVSAPNVQSVRDALARLDLLVVCDFFLSETARHRRPRAAGPAVGRGGGHDDQPRGTRAEAPEGARAARRRAQRAVDHGRARAPTRCPGCLEPRAGGRLRRARARIRRRRRRLLRAEPRAARRGIEAHWPFPAGSAGTPRLFADGFGHDDGRARLVAVQARGMPEVAARRRAHAHHGPAARALPERRADPARAGARGGAP